jgi:hypothetical protein
MRVFMLDSAEHTILCAARDGGNNGKILVWIA